MKRPIVPLTRRQFLVGTGGFTLALPMLSSLLVKQAYGADPVFVRHPRLWWLTTNHGAALESAFFPSESLRSDSQSLFHDHNVAAGALRGTAVDSATAEVMISPVLRAPSALLSERRISQLNVLRGIDIPFGIGHHTGGHLGNYAYNQAVGGIAFQAQSQPRPTVDQLLGWSPRFYADLSAVRERVLVMGTREISFGFSDPSTASGTVQNIRGATSSLELFQRVFMPASATGSAARVPVVDRVLSSYRSLRNGNRRLSAADRQRLDDHMDRLAELQRKLNTAVPSACGGASKPSDDSALHASLGPSDAVSYSQLYNEVVAAAFICGASRIAVLGLGDEQRFVDYSGDWHFEVAHHWLDSGKQDLLARSYQSIFQNVFLDLAARLDFEEADGLSYLDNSLLVWTQESGMSTHDPVSIPIVTAGSAAGFFRTGLTLDYRRVGNADSRFQPLVGAEATYAGLLYNQFLASILQAMGLPAFEFERGGHRGYGLPVVEQSGTSLPFATHYQDSSSRYFQIASDVLPFLKA
jgi:Protein of unknown function (DUF1552)